MSRPQFPVSMDLVELAAAIAVMDSDAQSEFFHAFAVALFRDCRNEHNAEMQMFYVSAALSDRDKRLFAQLGEK